MNGAVTADVPVEDSTEPTKPDYSKIVRVANIRGDLNRINTHLDSMEKELSKDDVDAEELMYLLERAAEDMMNTGGELEGMTYSLEEVIEEATRIEEGPPPPTPNPVEYMILNAITSDILEGKVNESAKEGWKVSGGMVVGRDGFFYQSVTRDPSGGLEMHPLAAFMGGGLY